MSVDSHLERLYADGRRNDVATSERSSMMLNITPSTGVFLDLLVSDSKPKRILELGTSNGYSTIWIARAAHRVGAHIDTVDISPRKTRLASRNLAECDLQGVVTIHTADCGDFLRDCDSLFYDLVFLDSDRTAYRDWVVDLVRVIRFGLLVVDNATTHPEEMLDFKRHLSNDLGFAIAVLPIGNGQMIVQDGG
ncbi:O-methyltransferase [Rhodopirellula baltica]|uniref:O-methyltransferase, family 3 n=1 Tax=Rhodopirellula baltica SWK14 TaxID=993516 RepID=L7CDI8_RHOBT|nr:class I SAM-dependent methyltransferase [Rhodopirellula baltica]ELP32053.1 O-methyltransferase, family 3 [Rhodopirellula baltica SWK14]